MHYLNLNQVNKFSRYIIENKDSKCKTLIYTYVYGHNSINISTEYLPSGPRKNRNPILHISTTI